MIKLIECPRDALQGLNYFVPTELKVQYINLLLQAGFDTIDFGSFVSPKAIPQMSDTAAVLEQLNFSAGTSKLLAIVANLRGIQEAIQYPQITYLGFPLSVSETFQYRNTNTNIEQSLHIIDELILLCINHHKTPVIYLSMGFGNPYGDEWNEDIVAYYTEKLVNRGIKIISLADTAGIATPAQISSLYSTLSKSYPTTEFGLHIHSTPDTWQEKIDAAYKSGCKRFDTALKGYGGCPMASDKLTGNIATENVISYLSQNNEILNLNMNAWGQALKLSSQIFHDTD